jgi:error-prone DNA polymerase
MPVAISRHAHVPAPLLTIVWRDLGEWQRRELLGAQLMAVHGSVEREGEVVHVIARRLADHSELPGGLPR